MAIAQDCLVSTLCLQNPVSSSMRTVAPFDQLRVWHKIFALSWYCPHASPIASVLCFTLLVLQEFSASVVSELAVREVNEYDPIGRLRSTYCIKLSSSLLEALIGGFEVAAIFLLPPVMAQIPPKRVPRTPMASCCTKFSQRGPISAIQWKRELHLEHEVV